jgi:hypothetical protein
MPMLDVCISDGTLTPEAETRLLGRLTDLLMQHEGVDPANPAARDPAWVFPHRPEVLYEQVAGPRCASPGRR